MTLENDDKARIRAAIIAQVDEALDRSSEVRILATGGFSPEDFDETLGTDRLPVYRTLAGPGEHRLEIFWRDPA